MESEEKKEPLAKPPADRGDTPAAESEPQPPADEPEDLPTLDEDWDSRVLCSDESCIGVIGPDGRCRECGKPAGPGFTPPRGGQPPVEEEPAGETREQHFQPEEDAVDEELVIDDDEWQQRILCSDESCIGVIGPDGRCRECGRPHKPDPQS